MKTTIVLPYPEADSHTVLWSKMENKTDFRGNPDMASRCTLAYAAVELREHLGRAMPDAQILFGNNAEDDSDIIELAVADPASRSEEFTFEPLENGVRILGDSRTGTLYGVYELLHRQGWRWFAPGEPGLLVGKPDNTCFRPVKKERVTPSYPLSRGVNRICCDSVDLMIWMARNRLNTFAYRPDTAPMAHKLGMLFKDGGHQWEAIMHPDYPAPEGGTLWEKHQDWFGLPAKGPRIKESARNNQFCMTNQGVLEYLANNTIESLCNELCETDILDIWFHDAWGGMCHCDKCNELGNDTDRALHFAAGLRKHLDHAMEKGMLNRQVALSISAYEGSCTMDPPSRPVPQPLGKAGDRILFCPIHRCFSHDFNDPECAVNAAYHSQLQGWIKAENAIPVVFGEYYNVSRFVDLPLVFTKRIANDLPALCAEGVKGMSYMHIPLEAWGPRALNNLLYSQLLWNTEASAPDLTNDYTRRFGQWGGIMRRVHELIESASTDIADWRCWAPRAVLRELHTSWDGSVPFKPLNLHDSHFKNEQEALLAGRKMLADLAEAGKLVDQARCEAQLYWAENGNLAGQPVFMNDLTAAADPLAPNEKVEREMHTGGILQLIEEMQRFTVYGQSVMGLMVGMLEYRAALAEGNDTLSQKAWNNLEMIEKQLIEHWAPPGAWIRPRPTASAYHQSLMRKMMARCRRWRHACSEKPVE